MERCASIERIIRDPLIPELVEFYNKYEKILAPFQHINSDKIDFNVEQVDELFEMPDVEINTDGVDPELIQDFLELLEETKKVTTKLIYLHAVNFELTSIYNQFLIANRKK
eukprot:NODE_326_length_10940_cov_0.392122.p8 type:complete len:111 gc:universal NODE_326_length_10940_cov_0.392122:4333-4001(-)